MVGVEDALTWCYEDFCTFYELLTLPDGRDARLEGFQRLILREVFAEGRVELLVLIPKGHAKTTLMAALAVFHLLITPNANCYIGAADMIQADEMYRFASHFIGSGSDYELEKYATVQRGYKLVRSRRDQGFIRVLASDDSKQGGKRQGFNPTLALIDELHAHENDNLYTDMRSGLFKRGGILVTITTAGWDIEGVLGQLRQGFLEADQNGGAVTTRLNAQDDGTTTPDLNGRLTLARKSQRSCMLEWACEKHDDLDDMTVVKLANPASWVTIDGLEDALESLTPWAFHRYRANVWTLAFDSWSPPASWDALYSPDVPVVVHRTWEDADLAELAGYIGSLFEPGAKVTGALDMARYRDCAAIVLIAPQEGRRPLVRAIVWRSGGMDHPIAYEPVEAAWVMLRENYRLQAAGYDPKYFDKSADDLLQQNVPMEEFPQSNERMCPAAAELRSAIHDGRFEHDGDPILGAHVKAGAAKDVGDNQFKVVTAKNGPPVDACIALIMAWALFNLGSSMYEDEDAKL